ncbi:MAG: hypothetical protein JO121_08500 [Deltaproteobacteria bacterium]|nr:hypothetical protein [Deltaproteobacteria bacterium]
MLNIPDIDRATRIHEEMEDTLRQLSGLLKTDGGHLTPAGIAVMNEGLNRGMSQSQVARLLSVSPAAISYRTRA